MVAVPLCSRCNSEMLLELIQFKTPFPSAAFRQQTQRQIESSFRSLQKSDFANTVVKVEVGVTILFAVFRRSATLLF